MNFIHMADMHLGYRQYGLEQRFLDFGHTFKEIAEYAVANKADFVLIAGDLFDKRSINAPTYVQAVHVLSILKEAGIPCVAIEGNHDRRFIKDGMSWLESLEWEGLLKVIKNHDGNLMGDFAEVGSTRIFGLGFSGSMTSAAIPQIAQEIKDINAKSPPGKTVLMMHAGVQSNMKYGITGEVIYEDLVCLKGVVDYLALGHYHSAYEIDGWAYNPGCPDTCSIAEVYEPKGFYHVTDKGAKLIPPNIRKFVILRVKADGHQGMDTLMADIRETLAKYGKNDSPVVHVIIEGTLNFDKSYINTYAIDEAAKEQAGALYAEVRFDLTNDEFSIASLESDAFDRASIEREVFRKLARSDSILAGNCDLFAAALSDIKDLAVKGADDRTLDGLFRRMFFEIKNAPVELMEVPGNNLVKKQELEESERPVKKPGKKTQKAGQVALDWGGGR
jgi:exonuclease SbcD